MENLNESQKETEKIISDLMEKHWLVICDKAQAILKLNSTFLDFTSGMGCCEFNILVMGELDYFSVSDKVIRGDYPISDSTLELLDSLRNYYNWWCQTFCPGGCGYNTIVTKDKIDIS